MWEAVLLGIVEGVTEFLPISSTGHLLITQKMLGHVQSDAFNVLIQVGPILAAAFIFRQDIFRLLTRFGEATVRAELLALVGSFFLTGLGGLALKAGGLELPETILPIAGATLLGALILFAVEWRPRSAGREEADWKLAVSVAAAQLVAGVFPGTSRSGAAIVAALLLGYSRPAAVRFAFLVGIPTMFAAGGLELVKAVRAGQGQELVSTESIVAFTVATVSAFAAVRWLLAYVQTRTFRPFAWYRLGLAAILFAGVAFAGW